MRSRRDCGTKVVAIQPWARRWFHASCAFPNPGVPAPRRDESYSAYLRRLPTRDGLAAELPGMPTRRIHSHAFPAVDVALTPFPHAEEQRRLVQEELDRTLFPELCVFEDALGTQVRVTLENAGAGHTFPSGSTKDRRVWSR